MAVTEETDAIEVQGASEMDLLAILAKNPRRPTLREAWMAHYLAMDNLTAVSLLLEGERLDP